MKMPNTECTICKESLGQEPNQVINLECAENCSCPNYHLSCLSQWLRTVGPDRYTCLNCCQTIKNTVLARIMRVPKPKVYLDSIIIGVQEFDVWIGYSLMFLIMMYNVKTIWMLLSRDFRFTMLVGINCICIFFFVLFLFANYHEVRIEWINLGVPRLYLIGGRDSLVIRRTFGRYVMILVLYSTVSILISSSV